LRSKIDSATVARMDAKLQHRGRNITDADIAFIRQLIAEHPKASRRELSKKLCEAWNWRQPNGTLRDMVCRSLMLELHRAGHIELPAIRKRPRNPLAQRGSERKKPVPWLVDNTPLCASLAEIRPLEFRQVRRTGEEPLFNYLIERYHYLAYTQPVGEHLKYLVYALGRPIACMAWSSAPRHLGPRDRFIRWSAAARRKNIRFVAYNTRFLILPFVNVPHLASHILGGMARMISAHWEESYGHPLYFLETFVDPERFRGISYRAANWIPLGRTTGLGKDDHTKKPNRSIKEILGYPVSKNFRQLLGDLTDAHHRMGRFERDGTRDAPGDRQASAAQRAGLRQAQGSAADPCLFDEPPAE
jgi:hypothetical protein